MLPLIFALAIMAAFVLTAPVYAQDEVPAETPVEAPAEIPAEGAGTEEAPATGELTPVLEEAADAGVTLVDETGEPLALATEDAAEALAGGDPWYKVGTTTYYFKFPGGCGATPNCQESPTPIELALTNINNTGVLPSDGFIYVEAGTYTDSVLVNASAPGSIYKGLKGFIGTVVNGVPTAVLNHRFNINSVESGFTIKGFEINYNINTAGIYIVNSKGTIRSRM